MEQILDDFQVAGTSCPLKCSETVPIPRIRWVPFSFFNHYTQRSKVTVLRVVQAVARY